MKFALYKLTERISVVKTTFLSTLWVAASLTYSGVASAATVFCTFPDASFIATTLGGGSLAEFSLVSSESAAWVAIRVVKQDDRFLIGAADGSVYFELLNKKTTINGKEYAYSTRKSRGIFKVIPADIDGGCEVETSEH